jgi:hypothetical protein
MSQSSAALIDYQIGPNSYVSVQDVLNSLSGRNVIVDGNFDSLITTSAAIAANLSSNDVATMYYGIAGATNGGTLSAGSWNVIGIGTEPLGMTSPVANVLTWTQAAAPTTSPKITQRIENVQTLQGRSATFSCWLWCASGTQTITNLQVLQHFGTGGSPSADVTTNVPVNWVLTTTPQRFSVLLNVPTIAGKTLGTTSGTHYLQVYVQYPIAASYAINTTQWQLEQSSPNAPPDGMPTTFEYRGVQAELARVQRYYDSFLIFMNQYAPSASFIVYQPYTFKASMRANPALAKSGGSITNISATAVATGDTEGCVLQATSTAAGGVVWSGTQVTADARF